MIRESVVSVFLVGLALFGPASLGAQAPPVPKDSARAAPGRLPPLDTALAARGRDLADRNSCRACHAYKASDPKTMGPSLNGVFQRRGAAYLEQKMVEPQFDDPKSQMPKLPLTPSERRAIIEFLRTLD